MVKMCSDNPPGILLGECSWFNPKEEAVDGRAHGFSAGIPRINQSLNVFTSHGLFSGYTNTALESVFETKTMNNVEDAGETEEDYDPSRLPPKFYLKDKLCVEAIVLEISGLLQTDKSGRAALLVVNRFEEEYRKWPLIRSTLVVRWKGPLRAKARLCIRGDLMPIRDQLSAPTPFRSPMKIVMAICAACNFSIVSMDISQAFIQADELNKKDQLLLVAPSCICLPWVGRIEEKMIGLRRFLRWCLRWYVRCTD